MKKYLLIFIILLIIITSYFFYNSKTGTDLKFNIYNQNKSDEITFTVIGKTDCQGAFPQKCLLIKTDEAIEYLYESIKGFEYEEKYKYVILVKKERAFKGPTPADASDFKYTLIKIISKEKS